MSQNHNGDMQKVPSPSHLMCLRIDAAALHHMTEKNRRVPPGSDSSSLGLGVPNGESRIDEVVEGVDEVVQGVDDTAALASTLAGEDATPLLSDNRGDLAMGD